MKRLRRLSFTVAALTALAAAGLAGAMIQQAASAPTATRQLLGAFKNPIGAKGRTLGLARTIIPAGVTLPLHYHQGTQDAYILKGTIVYTVKSGRVRVMKGLASGSPKLVRMIKGGQSGKITAGEWIVEQPTVIHTAHANTNVVVLQATLLQNGAPPATPVAG